MADLTRRQVLGMGAASLLRVPSSVRTPTRPEYERTLSRALVCFPDASRDTDPAVLSRFLEAAFRDLGFRVSFLDHLAPTSRAIVPRSTSCRSSIEEILPVPPH